MSIFSAEEIRTKFWVKVRKTRTCWLWTAYVNGDGYGKYRSTNYAHRWAWVEYNGSIPNGLWVLHSCDNPRCVNPSHLFLGTPLDNAKDRDDKGRNNAPKGIAHGMSKLSEKQVIEIRTRAETKEELQRTIAKDYGVGQYVVSQILLRKRWRHL